ncbi:MAG: hypothetical protein IKN54_08735 [Lachnospiraceae bacterium]|nr:hypothetical protein [Lachnospiraceae bacterium]
MKKKVFAFTMVCLLTVSAVPVFAKSVSSPEPAAETSVTIGGKVADEEDDNKVTGGKVSFEVVGEVEEDGQKYQKIEFNAKPDGNNSFFEWQIDGNYKIVEGDLNSGKIVIIAYDDIEINAVFKDANGNIVTEGPKDDSTKSPKTGVPVGALLITMLGSGAVAIKSRKKF